MLMTYLKLKGREALRITVFYRQEKIKIMVIVQKKILAELLSPMLSTLPNDYLKKNPTDSLLQSTFSS